VDRAVEDPPQVLVDQIFPFLAGAVAKLEEKKKQTDFLGNFTTQAMDLRKSLSLQGFLRLLTTGRAILLQVFQSFHNF
jgi:hypothetical protein